MWPRIQAFILLLAGLLALASARPYAGGWNDGSRLAAVQMIGERGSLIIDDSIFIKIPQDGPRPYASDPSLLNVYGTFDKLRINDHFYSDKPPVVSVLLGGVYQLTLRLGGPTAQERPDLFCRLMTWLSAGMPYVMTLWLLWRLFRQFQLPDPLVTLLMVSVAFSSYAIAYIWYVNNHMLFLAVAAWICYQLCQSMSSWRSAGIGFLAGFGYTLDLAVGPALWLGLFTYYFLAKLSWKLWFLLVVSSLPWLMLHHVLNYLTGGTIGPANAVKEYLDWPGSPFTGSLLTGGWHHTPLSFVLYSLDLLVGKKGYFSHNFPLMMWPAACFILWRYHPTWRPFVGFSTVWFLAGWLVYSAGSKNYSGGCCSIRWFLPYLAPMFVIVSVLVLHSPRYRRDLVWLTVVGLPLGGLMWWGGTWAPRMEPGFWGFLAVALTGWIHIRRVDWFACKTVSM